MDVYQIKIIESVVVIIGYWASKFISQLIIDRAGIKFSYQKIRIKILKKIINILLFLLLISILILVWGVDQTRLMYYLTSLLTVLGIAFVAQWSIISNLTSTLIIYFNHPVKIGDTIMVIDKDYQVEGRVSDIGIFFVILKTVDNEQITIPCNVFLQKMIKKKN